MSRIGYINPRFYQPRQTWPQLAASKVEAQAANEPRTDESNEQSPPPDPTPDSAISLNPSSKASNIEVFRQCLKDGLTSAGAIACKMGVSKGTVSKWATKAIGAGWLKKNGRQYALVR